MSYIIAPCPTNCTDADLIGLPTDSCNTSFRRTTPDRFGFFDCSTDLPQSGNQAAINAAMKALFDAGKLVFTSPLALLTPQDPSYDEVQIDDCSPATPLLATRTITFEDRTAIDLSTVSPFTGTKYFDYDFWIDKINNQRNIRWMLGYCNGDVKVIPNIATLRGFVDYLRAQTAGGLSTETKKFSVTFNGDPLDMSIKPTWNFIDAGITL